MRFRQLAILPAAAALVFWASACSDDSSSSSEPEIESSYAPDSVTITVKWGKTTDRLTFHYGPETPEFHRLPEN